MGLGKWIADIRRSDELGENWAKHVISAGAEIDGEVVGELAHSYAPDPEVFASSFYSTVDNTPTKDGMLSRVRDWLST